MKKQYCNVARYKNQVLVREIIDGKENNRKVSYTPSLYQRTNRKTDIRDFYNQYYLEKVTFKSPYEMGQFLKTYSDIKDEVWGNVDIPTQFIHNEKYNDSDVSKIVVSFIDIEVCTRYKNANDEWVDGGFPDAVNASFPITAICDYRSDDKKYYLFSSALGWTKEKSQLSYADDIVYVPCKTEDELIKKWIQFFVKKYPHIITGYNSQTFDIPYIINRLKHLYGDEAVQVLSPWRIVEEKEITNKFGKKISTYNIVGIPHLDYLDLLKKYNTKPREKFTLYAVSKEEIPEEQKLEFDGSHGELYYDDPVFYNDYNVQDVRCVYKLDDKFHYIHLVIVIAYFAGINFDDVMSPMRTWDFLIAGTCEDAGYIIPLKGESKPKETYEGAYVHEPVPGRKGAIMSFDYTSLYPSLMMLFYIAPDVHVTGTRKNLLHKEFIDIIKSIPEASEMYDELMRTGTFNDYYIHNDLPEKVTQFLQREKVSLTTNVEFYDVSRKSHFIGLIEKLFKERKADKKKSFEYKKRAKAIKDELKRRGINV